MQISRKQSIVLFLSIFSFFIYTLQNTLWFLPNTDYAFALAVANQIILYDKHPFIDFYMDYGPLVFYMSALFQFFSQERLIGEIALWAIGYAISYYIFFIIILRLGVKKSRAIMVLLFALFLAPTHWSYFFQLSLFLTLISIVNYLEKKTFFSLILLSISLTIAALFRHDYGVYCAIGATVGVLVDGRDDIRTRIKNLFILGFLTIFLFSMWLVFLFFNGALLSYFDNIFYGTIGKTTKFSTPHPLLNFDNLLVSIFYLIFFLGPTLGVIIFIKDAILRNNIDESIINKSNPTNVTLCYTIFAMSFVHLASASHRADYLHLLYIMPLSILSVIAIDYLKFRMINKFRSFDLVGIMVLITFLSALIHNTYVYSVFVQSPKEKFYSLKKAFEKHSDFMEIAYNEDHLHSRWKFNIPYFIDKCIEDDVKFIALPISTGLLYMSKKELAGKHIFATPGFLDFKKYQYGSIESLKNQNFIILWKNAARTEDIPDNEVKSSHQLMWNDLINNYNKISDFKIDGIHIKAFSNMTADEINGNLNNQCKLLFAEVFDYKSRPLHNSSKLH